MKVLVLASHYVADHVARLHPYRPINPTASTWNTALLEALGQLDIDLHVVQFWPVTRTHVIREGRLTHHYLPRVPKIDSVTSQLKRLRVAGLVRELEPDVVHGTGSEHGYAWAAVGHGVPSVVTIHGYLKMINALPGHRSLFKSMFLVREERRALLQADRVIAINEYMRDRLVADGCNIARTVIVPNALNPVYLQSFEEPSTRSIDILMVGTLHRLKNQHVALELFSRLAQGHGAKPHVVIVGAPTAESKHYHAQLQVLKASLGLDNVEFVGRKAPDELADLYRDSRFLLHISEFESDSAVVAEALACGALPVVNPVAALAFRVHHGCNGYHLPIADRAEAAAALATILQDEASRLRLATAGRVAMLEQRRPRIVAQATHNMYLQLMQSVGHPAGVRV